MADFTALKTAIQTYIKQNGNEEITGEKLQEILLSVVTTLGDSAINDLVTALNDEVAARQNADGTLQQNITNEATARGNGDTALSDRLGSTITAENTAADQIGAEAEARAAADTALQNLIDGITDNIANGSVYAGIATPSSTPATGKVFYLALTAGTYTNFGSTEVSQGINILKYNGSAWSLDAFIGIDDTPTPNSPKLVKSGGVYEGVNQLEQKVGSVVGFSMYKDKYTATNGELEIANGWSTTSWIPISLIPIFNDAINLSHSTDKYQDVVFPVLFKDANNTITTLSTVETLYPIESIPAGMKYIAFNINAILDYLDINKLSDTINKILVEEIPRINENIEDIAQLEIVGQTENPLDETLKPGLYGVLPNSTNVPNDYYTNTYGWVLVIASDFKLLWNQLDGVFWGHIRSDIPWINMSESSYAKSISDCSIIVDFINTAISSGALTLSDIEIAATESYSRHLLLPSGILTAYDNELYNVNKYNVVSGAIYHVVASKQYNNLVFAFYDSTGKMLKGVGDGTMAVQMFDGLVMAPYNSSYMYVAYKTDVKIGSLSTPSLNHSVERLKWEGKKWVAIGDSLTEVNSRTTKNYLAYIAEKTGISVVNMGVSGTGYRREYDTNKAFYQRASSIPTDADVITIFGSFNDMGVDNYQVGNPTDTGTDTICGCVNNTLDTILSVYMTAGKVPTIGVITPTPWIGKIPIEPTSAGALYCDAIIACCKRKSIPVLDLYRCSNLHPDNATFRTLAYSKDDGNGVHPDETGHKIIAPMFENFLESLLLN